MCEIKGKKRWRHASLLEIPLGAISWIGMRKREGPTLSLAMVWKERDRGAMPPLMHKNPKGVPSVGAPFTCPLLQEVPTQTALSD